MHNPKLFLYLIKKNIKWKTQILLNFNYKLVSLKLNTYAIKIIVCCLLQRSKQKKAGIADPEKSDKVVRWNDGTPVGPIEFSDKAGSRILRVPADETAFIEGLCYHELVDSTLKKCKNPKVIFKDISKEQEAKKTEIEKRKIVDSIYINMSDEAIEDLAVILGYPKDDANSRLFSLKDNKPDQFLSYFKEPLKKNKFYTADLKEETILSAFLKRAVLKKVVTVKAGSILFEDEVVGNDFNAAVTNLMDTTKQGKNNLLSLIKDKLSKS